MPLHRQVLDEFRGKFWDDYRELRAYQQQPTAAEAARLDAAFDPLFATQTGYRLLDAAPREPAERRSS